MKSFLFSFLLLFVFCGSAQTLDLAHAEITINMGTEVQNGTIGGVKADVKFDANGNITAITASAAVSTVDTGEPSRDPEVRKEFLKGENHPSIEFKSSQVKTTESGWLATGMLSMAGKSMKINMPVVKADGKFIARMKFYTKDFGVYDSDKITIVHISIPVK